MQKPYSKAPLVTGSKIPVTVQFLWEQCDLLWEGAAETPYTAVMGYMLRNRVKNPVYMTFRQDRDNGLWMGVMSGGESVRLTSSKYIRLLPLLARVRDIVAGLYAVADGAGESIAIVSNIEDGDGLGHVRQRLYVRQFELERIFPDVPHEDDPVDIYLFSPRKRAA